MSAESVDEECAKSALLVKDVEEQERVDACAAMLRVLFAEMSAPPGLDTLPTNPTVCAAPRMVGEIGLLRGRMSWGEHIVVRHDGDSDVVTLSRGLADVVRRVELLWGLQRVFATPEG